MRVAESGLVDHAAHMTHYGMYRLNLAIVAWKLPEIEARISHYYDNKRSKPIGTREIDIPEYVSLSFEKIQYWLLVWFIITIMLPILEFWRQIAKCMTHTARMATKCLLGLISAVHRGTGAALRHLY